MTGETIAVPTRLCASCSERKTVKGVWYLVNGGDSSPAFFCEACFAVAPKPRNRPETPGDGLVQDVPMHGRDHYRSPSGT